MEGTAVLIPLPRKGWFNLNTSTWQLEPAEFPQGLRHGTIWHGDMYGVYLWYYEPDGRLVGTIQPTLGL